MLLNLFSTFEKGDLLLSFRTAVMKVLKGLPIPDKKVTEFMNKVLAQRNFLNQEKDKNQLTTLINGQLQESRALRWLLITLLFA